MRYVARVYDALWDQARVYELEAEGLEGASREALESLSGVSAGGVELGAGTPDPDAGDLLVWAHLTPEARGRASHFGRPSSLARPLGRSPGVRLAETNQGSGDREAIFAMDGGRFAIDENGVILAWGATTGESWE